MSRRLALSILLIPFFGLPQSGSAQTSSIAGTISDISGAVVPHAKVSAVNKATNGRRSVDSDDSGNFRITNLSPGIYDLLIEKTGFKVVEYSRVELTVDQV